MQVPVSVAGGCGLFLRVLAYTVILLVGPTSPQTSNSIPENSEASTQAPNEMPTPE
jgi:hypothetical protein